MYKRTKNLEVFFQGLPHARGGEPSVAHAIIAQSFVFPTHVGVNRRTGRDRFPIRSSSPRTWG